MTTVETVEQLNMSDLDSLFPADLSIEHFNGSELDNLFPVDLSVRHFGAVALLPDSISGVHPSALDLTMDKPSELETALPPALTAPVSLREEVQTVEPPTTLAVVTNFVRRAHFEELVAGDDLQPHPNHDVTYKRLMSPRGAKGLNPTTKRWLVEDRRAKLEAWTNDLVAVAQQADPEGAKGLVQQAETAYMDRGVRLVEAAVQLFALASAPESGKVGHRAPVIEALAAAQQTDQRALATARAIHQWQAVNAVADVTGTERPAPQAVDEALRTAEELALGSITDRCIPRYSMYGKAAEYLKTEALREQVGNVSFAGLSFIPRKQLIAYDADAMLDD